MLRILAKKLDILVAISTKRLSVFTGSPSPSFSPSNKSRCKYVHFFWYQWIWPKQTTAQFIMEIL